MAGGGVYLKQPQQQLCQHVDLFFMNYSLLQFTHSHGHGESDPGTSLRGRERAASPVSSVSSFAVVEELMEAKFDC